MIGDGALATLYGDALRRRIRGLRRRGLDHMEKVTGYGIIGS